MHMKNHQAIMVIMVFMVIISINIMLKNIFMKAMNIKQNNFYFAFVSCCLFVAAPLWVCILIQTRTGLRMKIMFILTA